MIYTLWYTRESEAHQRKVFLYRLSDDWRCKANYWTDGKWEKPLEMEEYLARKVLKHYVDKHYVHEIYDFYLVPVAASAPRQLLIDFQPMEAV